MEDVRLHPFRQRVLDWTPRDINTGWNDILVPQGAAEVGGGCGDDLLLNWTVDHLRHHEEIKVDRETSTIIQSGLTGRDQPDGVYLNQYSGNWGFALAACKLPEAQRKPFSRQIRGIAEFIMENAVRGADGVILHSPLTPTVWVDTLYYTAPLLAHACRLTGEEAFGREAIRQAELHGKYLRNEGTGLWHHDADPVTGARTLALWSRGNGWILSALAEVLAVLPEEFEGTTRLLHWYRRLAEALLSLRHPTGLWRTDMTRPDSHLETSGTCMHLQAMCVGIAHKWLDPGLLPEIEKSFRELLSWIHPETGRFLGSQSVSGRGGWETLKLTPFGENSFASGFVLRLIAARATLHD